MFAIICIYSVHKSVHKYRGYMAKTINKLTDLKVKRATGSGVLSDGGGLYLQLTKSGARSWFYRYETSGKGRKKGLGGYPAVSLSQARVAAQQCRELRSKGLDPVDHYRELKRSAVAAEQVEKAKAVTFQQCAERYIESMQSEWSNAKHAYQWTQSLEHYAYPFFGDLPVGEIDTGLVMQAIEKIWVEKTETATRVRQRVESILDYAKTLEVRSGENPARWRGHLDKLLPKPSKVRRVVHQPAMDYRAVPEFYRDVREKDFLAAITLSFIILTATRSGESRYAKWDEFDFDNRVWTIPAERMKARKPFRVPLSEEMITVLEAAKLFKKSEFVFPSPKGGQGISDTSVRRVLKGYCPNLTVHGFRSTFRDWAAEQTNYPRDIAESALSHVLESRTEAAYQRGDKLEKRRRLMSAWSEYLLDYYCHSLATPIRGIKSA